MNKKAALFHWVLFGVLAALGIFFLLSSSPIGGEAKKGTWQLAFLQDYYLEAEKDLLKIGQAARIAGSQTALELGEKGGFWEENLCGRLENFNLWNKKEEWCWPEIEKAVSLKTKEKLKLLLPENNFQEITFEGKELVGKGEKKTLASSTGAFTRYTYNTSFRVNLGYSFDEYQETAKEAQSLVAKCRNNKKLEACLKEEKKASWQFKDCEKEEYKEKERQVLFCIKSPAEVFIGPALKPVQYKLALDFSPIAPWVVEEVKVSSVKAGYEVSFEQDKTADSYAVYYTNWPSAEEKSGSAEEIFSTMPQAEAFGYFYQKVVFNSPQAEDCPAEKGAGGVYLCAGKVVYVLKDEKLETGKEYLAAATAVEEGKESEINRWAKFKS